MKHLQKPDAKGITDYIDSLCHAPFLDSTRSWWPRYVYHFTNIDNAIGILESGYLYSRSFCLERGLMCSDNASQDVLEGTKEQWMDYVRLYFRPRTPTQYRNEGYRPIGQREINSHCPVPIYFIFDAKRILSRKEALFSHCSLARHGSGVYSSADEFKRIPFNFIYHDGPLDMASPEGKNIIGYRQAEVVIPNALDLQDLKYIWCRSEAEYQTLLYRLSRKTLAKWKKGIGSGKKGNFFYRNWVFVENVELTKEKASFRFNGPSSFCDPFSVKVEIIETSAGVLYSWEDSSYKLPANSKLEFDLNNLKDPSSYEIKLLFDQQIMFIDKFKESEYIPF